MSSFTSFTAPLDVRYDAEASRALGAAWAGPNAPL